MKIPTSGVFICFTLCMVDYKNEVFQDKVRTDCSSFPEVISTRLVDTLYIIIYRQAICNRTEA